MILTATSRPRRRSRARYTVAIPPWPISSRSSYLTRSGLLSTGTIRRKFLLPSRDLLDAHGVRRAAHADACPVHHHVAFTRTHEPRIGEHLSEVAHLIVERRLGDE